MGQKSPKILVDERPEMGHKSPKILVDGRPEMGHNCQIHAFLSHSFLQDYTFLWTHYTAFPAVIKCIL